MGRPFITASTSHMRVSNASSFRTCSLRRAFRILRVVLIHRSQIPPWCDAAGAGGENPTNFLLQQVFMYTLSVPLLNAGAQFFLTTDAKIEPLSVLTNTGLPLLVMNRRRAFMKESVSSECAISMWTALTVRHMKIQPYLFT